METGKTWHGSRHLYFTYFQIGFWLQLTLIFPNLKGNNNACCVYCIACALCSFCNNICHIRFHLKGDKIFFPCFRAIPTVRYFCLLVLQILFLDFLCHGNAAGTNSITFPDDAVTFSRISEDPRIRGSFSRNSGDPRRFPCPWAPRPSAFFRKIKRNFDIFL